MKFNEKLQKLRKEKGMSQENIDKMLIENPKRILES